LPAGTEGGKAGSGRGGEPPTAGSGSGGGGAGAPSGGKASGGASAAGGLAGATSGGKNSLSGGQANAAGGSAQGGQSGQVRLPRANAGFDYQIGGAYTPPVGVQVVSRDRNSAPAAGIYNICYVNGFQTQPDEDSFWNNQHPDLILKDSSGAPIVDANWGETLLDTSTAEKRAALSNIVGGWIASCASDGFDAVEIDNLDSYSRSQSLLTQANNIAFMQLLSTAAHAHGLAIAQKNSTELLGNASQMGTDFAVAEECNRWGECDAYRSVYGDRVFVIEYRMQDFQKGCSDYPGLSIVLRDLDVSPPSSSSYVYSGC
jgi:hypothetical protein